MNQTQHLTTTNVHLQTWVSREFKEHFARVAKARGLDWDLDLLAHLRQDEHSILGKRRSPKLVHNLIFSMPPGTSPQKVLAAVRKLAVNEFAFRHRYALVLHTDEAHPHVHLVVKAESEQGVRLNIRKATLRHWREQFATHLQELGVAANATERAMRGETRTPKKDGIYRAGKQAAMGWLTPLLVSSNKCRRRRRIRCNWSSSSALVGAATASIQ